MSRQEILEAFADQLRAAESSRQPVQALTEQADDLSVAEAYRVQGINIARRLAAGENLVGRKIGLTSKAMQEQLGVDEPDVGAITDTMVFPEGEDVETSRFLQPRLEAEFAFRLGSDVAGEITAESVRAAISSVMVAAEIIDSRIRDWKIKLVDTVADNASSAGVVFGPEVPATSELLDALPGLRVDLEVDGDVVASGEGSAILGHPIEAVVWLARTLASTGEALRAGDVILAGAVHASVPLTAGETYAVRQEQLPPLSFRAV